MGLSRLTTCLLVLALTGLPLAIGVSWIGDVFVVHHNFRAASTDLFRSGQLRGDEWAESLDAAHYRSVLNLQGPKNTSWYRKEVRFAAEHGLEHYDFAMSAHVAPSLSQMNEIVEVLRQAPKPILIHCKNGADRSGLVAALYQLAIEGQPQRVAEQQLSVWYGHIPFWNRSSAMDAALAEFGAVAHAQAAANLHPGKEL